MKDNIDAKYIARLMQQNNISISDIVKAQPPIKASSVVGLISITIIIAMLIQLVSRLNLGALYYYIATILAFIAYYLNLSHRNKLLFECTNVIHIFLLVIGVNQLAYFYMPGIYLNLNIANLLLCPMIILNQAVLNRHMENDSSKLIILMFSGIFLYNIISLAGVNNTSLYVAAISLIIYVIAYIWGKSITFSHAWLMLTFCTMAFGASSLFYIIENNISSLYCIIPASIVSILAFTTRSKATLAAGLTLIFIYTICILGEYYDKTEYSAQLVITAIAVLTILSIIIFRLRRKA